GPSPDYTAHFGSEEQCRDYLFSRRWPHGFACPKCSQRHYRWLTSKLLQCTACRTETSLTAGTLLHGTRKPLKDWFHAAYLVVQLGANARDLMRRCKLTYKIAWLWAHKLRRAMADPKTTLDAPFPPFDQHRAARLGQTGPNAARLWFCRHGHFRWNAVRPGAVATPCCQRLDSKDWATPDADEGSRFLLHRAPMLPEAKEWLFRASSGSVSDKHLAAYLRETEFRLNHRGHTPAQTAQLLLARVVTLRPSPYRAITGKP